LPHPDTWLFLPPEVEALVPGLLARLAAVGSEPDARVEADERERIETLILEGDVDQWRTFLRQASMIVADYGGADSEAQALLASILDDQFILARAVVDLELPDLDARQRLARAGATPPRGSRVS
jgi:hypothetical protein